MTDSPTVPPTAPQTHIDVDHWANQLILAKQASQPYPRITDAHPDLEATTAYAIQRAFVSSCVAQGDRIAGFKAALTAKPAQQAMGVPGPVAGVLWQAGQRQASQTVSLTEIPDLLLETEFGFHLAKTQDQAVSSIEQLQGLVASCQPMVEWACLNFGQLAPTGVDMIASNAASRCYVPGPQFAWQQHDLDQQEFSLTREDTTLHESSSGTLMEGQWQALLWLVNLVIEQGYAIEPHHYLMTGSVGGIHPAQVGRHQATYGDAGTIKFTVADA